MATIELRDVSVVYPDGTHALSSVCLTVPEGKVTAVLGPSGSGKSTALKVIGGLVPATAGRIFVGGSDVTALPAEKRDAGIVFQSYALFPNMTVEENVEFGLKVRRIPPAERRKRVSAMLATVKIEPLRSKRPRQLSGGEAQRVALARAMVFNPKILLMDEPLSALDAQIRESLRGELRRFLQTFGTTTVYVTHDQAEAMALGDRVVILRGGRVMQVGAPAEVYARPASLFVAGFIGNANLVPCVVDGAGRISLPFGHIHIPCRGDELGERVLMFRPEDVVVTRGGPDTHFAVKIDEVVFLGSRRRLGGYVDGSYRVSIDVDNGSQAGVGDVLPVRLDVDKVHLLDKEDR
jgi:putative spermidine/putrescine transport system ATP-binding protein